MAQEDARMEGTGPATKSDMSSRFWAASLGAKPAELVGEDDEGVRTLVLTGAALTDASVGEGVRVSVWLSVPAVEEGGKARSFVLCTLVGGRCTFAKLDIVLDQPARVHVLGGHEVTLHGMELVDEGAAAVRRVALAVAEAKAGVNKSAKKAAAKEEPAASRKRPTEAAEPASKKALAAEPAAKKGKTAEPPAAAKKSAEPAKPAAKPAKAGLPEGALSAPFHASASYAGSKKGF
jgi:hypothetical protein